MKTKKTTKMLKISILTLALGASMYAHAQEASTPIPQSFEKASTPTSEAVEQQLEEVIAVGTRTAPRTATSTPLPVDNISYKEMQSTGQTSFDKALQYRVPSFNTVNTPVNDATTLLDPYEIRNLGPSRTLILINGKRKNLSSLLYVQFAPGRGETGVDISAIPTDAIKNVEILRDGASAQYGSDAIAGVMNIVLKDKYEYTSVNLNSGITNKGDGLNYGLSVNSGANFGKKGFLNYTAAVSQQDNATRSGIIDLPTEIYQFGGNGTDDAAIASYLKKYPTANNLNSTAAISAAKMLINAGVPVGEKALIYGNAAFISKKAISNANYRPNYWKQDYGLLHAAGTDYIGYMPTFEGDLVDYNGTIGVKNETNGWKQDLSFTVGGNTQKYTVNNTVNHSLKAGSPTSFKPGGYGFSHFVGNIDISKNLTDNFGIAFGSEVRTETYDIFAGDTASFSGSGSNSFPGINSINAGSNSRFNLGAYFDASLDITKDWVINGTIRGEKYSDFGDAFVYKISSRYKFADDKLTLRGSYSTGFRAPTLHQIFAQSVQAAFIGGKIELSGLFNNKSAQAKQLGIPQLKAEQSENFTVGLGINPNKNFSVTLDYYDITIKDRIVYSSSIASGKDDSVSALYNILKTAGVKTIQFFINGIQTHTNGLDFVASYKNINLGSGKLAINLAGNYTITNEIVGKPQTPKAIADAGSDILNVQITSLLTKSRPQYKVIFGVDYYTKKFNINLNNTLFGSTEFQDLDNGGSDMNNIKQVFTPAVVTDLNFGYNFTDKVSTSFTISNLFNILPSWSLKAINAAGTTVLNNAAAKNLLEGNLCFSGRYRILGYNGSQFSQLGTTFQLSLNIKL